MDRDECERLAAEIIDLKVLGWVVHESLANALPSEIADVVPSMMAAHRKAMIGLYVEHYDEQQLIAECEFYRSDVGQAIIEAQKRMRTEIPAAVARAFEEFGGTAGVIRKLALRRNAGEENGTMSKKPAFAVAMSSGRRDSLPPPDYNLPARWRIEVRSCVDEDHAFKAALAIDDRLMLVESTTPYDVEFSASKLTAFFESDENGALSVAQYCDAQGEFRKCGEFSGSRIGKVVFDPRAQDGYCLMGSGTRF